MKTKQLAEVLERVESWPAHAQDELAEIARDIEQSLNGGDYQPTEAELAGIDRGLRDADQGRFATEAEVEAVFAKFSMTIDPMLGGVLKRAAASYGTFTLRVARKLARHQLRLPNLLPVVERRTRYGMTISATQFD